MFILVQNIHISWSRPASGFDPVKIKTIPDSIPLDPDSIPAKSGYYYIQDVCFDEWNNYKEYKNVRCGKLSDSIKFNCLELKVKDGFLETFYEHKPELIGSPKRAHSSYSMNLFTMEEGRWGQVKYNGQLTCMDAGGFVYHKQIFNIILLDTSKKVFMDKPLHSFEDMEELSY